jgi:hypothetical protein
LTPLEIDFLDAGLAARDAEWERDRRRARRLRGLSTGLAIVAVLAIIAGAVAVVQRQRADENARRAERDRIVADVERLTAEAANTLGEDPDLPILLALAAYDQSQQLEDAPRGNLMSVMQTAVQSSRVLLELTDVGSVGALSPDGDVIAARLIEDPTVVVLLDAETGEELGRLDAGRPVVDLAYDTGGRRLALAIDTMNGPDTLGDGPFGGSTESAIVIIEASSSTVLDRKMLERPVVEVEFSPDGGHLFAIVRNDAAGWVPVSTIVSDLSESSGPSDSVDGIAAGWTPDGRLALVADGTASFLDVTSGESVGPEIDVGESEPQFLDLGRDGDRIVVTSSDIEVWSVDDVEPSADFDLANPNTSGAAIFSPDESHIVASDSKRGGIPEFGQRRHRMVR